MVFFIIFLVLWAIVGGISFLYLYITDIPGNGFVFVQDWHFLNNMQKRFAYVAHGPLILAIASICLTIQMVYRLISGFYTSMMKLLGKVGNND